MTSRDISCFSGKTNRSHVEVDLADLNGDQSRSLATSNLIRWAIRLARERFATCASKILRLPVHYREVIVLCEMGRLDDEAGVLHRSLPGRHHSLEIEPREGIAGRTLPCGNGRS